MMSNPLVLLVLGLVAFFLLMAGLGALLTRRRSGRWHAAGAEFGFSFGTQSKPSWNQSTALPPMSGERSGFPLRIRVELRISEKTNHKNVTKITRKHFTHVELTLPERLFPDCTFHSVGGLERLMAYAFDQPEFDFGAPSVERAFNFEAPAKQRPLLLATLGAEEVTAALERMIGAPGRFKAAATTFGFEFQDVETSQNTLGEAIEMLADLARSWGPAQALAEHEHTPHH